jgi:hypothetical protein
MIPDRRDQLNYEDKIEIKKRSALSANDFHRST